MPPALKLSLFDAYTKGRGLLRKKMNDWKPYTALSKNPDFPMEFEIVEFLAGQDAPKEALNNSKSEPGIATRK